MTYEEVRKAYYSQLDEASVPQRQRAKAAFKICVDYSVKFQYFDDEARTCQTWLSKNYEEEFPPVEELIPAPQVATVRPLAMPVEKKP